jgi:hypothetical protein
LLHRYISHRGEDAQYVEEALLVVFGGEGTNDIARGKL